MTGKIVLIIITIIIIITTTGNLSINISSHTNREEKDKNCHWQYKTVDIVESGVAKNAASDVNPMGDFELVNGAGADNDAALLGAGGGNDSLVNGLDEPATSSTNGPTNIYEAISQQDTVRAEPEKIKLWREEQRARLQAKDEEEEVRKKELKEKAKKELDDWYKHHQEQLEKTKENNRASEEAFVKERDEKVPGQSWEKITRLCEFNPKNTKCTKDVARFRSILLQLKQTPLVR
ncbi:clathrin light chain [Elysia marginata]|uniref:Clathrin light chain n=1 Tax=Elysia marginata TaxID=1093978 RepID=A0AAV4JMN4_9GAST|nr:clathrin light chain [Elysia marginata]